MKSLVLQKPDPIASIKPYASIVRHVKMNNPVRSDHDVGEQVGQWSAWRSRNVERSFGGDDAGDLENQIESRLKASRLLGIQIYIHHKSL